MTLHGAVSPSGAGNAVALRRLVHKADFERLLGAPGGWRSAHFVAHHLPMRPWRPARPSAGRSPEELSTAGDESVTQPVDKRPEAHWLGVVVPKRHAKRAVTRSLIKRQMRAAVLCQARELPPGLWLLRLRQPFPTRDFPAAASQALARAVRDELALLLQRVGRGRPAPRAVAGAP